MCENEITEHNAVREAEINSALRKIKFLAEAIKDAGSIPSGHLYAVVMSKFSLPEYEKIITILKKSGLVAENMNVLFWKGEI